MEKWDGVERRSGNREFCQAHISFATSMTKIECSVANIEKGLLESITFKTAMVSSVVGILILFIANTVTFAFLYGQLVKQVSINTDRLANIEIIEKEAQQIRATNVARIVSLENKLK
jgi:hypothetical protein